MENTASKNVKLHVDNLKISFHTTDGKLQAVRNISFDLMEGETLSIVGESGSGKSVTSKAILGILAGNSIVEDGSIIYDGKDLLKISEDEFHHIRGDKIAMIFQDPMSSLNPIVKIGRQLTEAMILKGKARQKESRTNFNSYLKKLKQSMIHALAEGNSARAAECSGKCDKFDTFEYKHLELESSYNTAFSSAVETISEIQDIVFEFEKNAANDVAFRLKEICKKSIESIETYVVREHEPELRNCVNNVRRLSGAAKKGKDTSEICISLNKIKDILTEATSYTEPNFFSLGYYSKFSGKPIPDMSVEELNKFTRQYLDENFMLDFISDTSKTLEYSAGLSYTAKTNAMETLLRYRNVFEEKPLEKKKCYDTLKTLSSIVTESIDPLNIKKDSMIYTFGSGLETTLDKYFYGVKNNPVEEKRFERDTRKYESLVSRGKDPDWKVVAPSVMDLDALQSSMLRQIDELVAHYKQLIADRESRDYAKEAIDVIDYLKACASGVVRRVTKRMAKDKAIKLMKEVGISEPRKRYDQYPFEFSGGMRQRIVIAIALAADPDILICDEPTTALDVTIQSQILELINKLKEERHLSVIFITHDLGVVANMADRIAVMYAGKIVEYGTASDVFYESAHPYTWALLSSMPDLDTNEKLEAIPGTPPDMHYPPVGDAFAERNKYAMKIDFERQPPMFKISDTHYAATWLAHPDAPKVEPPKVIVDRIARMKNKRKEQENG